MGYDVQIEIDKGQTGGTFTNHDIISGLVKLTTTSSLTLSYIQVKLEGVSETQLVIPGRSAREIERDERSHRDRRKDRRKDKRDKKDKFRQDTHKILYDSSIVFPPENVRQVSQAKDFTLTPGTYTYAFSFKIPLNTSCKKLSGISNKISFSKNSFDLVINNGNFNTKYLVNSANNFMMNANGSWQTTNVDGQSHLTKAYHMDAQLPPSLPDMNGMASIKYFVKVTCKRASILKANLRAYDPFVFLPLDLDRRYEPLRTGEQFVEYKERYFRKEVTFKDRLPSANGKPTTVKDLPPTPELKSRGFISSFFGKPAQQLQATLMNAVDVSFAFELRMPHPPSLSPTAVPSFRLFFVSSVDPATYTLANRGKPEHSNGLGIMYLQSLKLELKCVTLISVLDNDGSSSEIHQSRIEEDIPLCHNTYQNLQFDLMKCKRQKSSTASSSGFGGNTAYELEIPSKFYENCRFPRNLPPTFHTCNIARGYGLSVQVGISSEPLLEAGSTRDRTERTKYVDVFCPDIHVLSGLKLTSTLHSNASGTSLGKVSEHKSGSFSNGYPPDFKPPLSAKNSQHSVPPMNARPDMTPPISQNVYEEDHKSEAPLPTYNDVVRESSYQDDSEHQRARYRYGG